MSNEALMATRICKGVYKMEASETFMKSCRTAGAGMGVGLIASKMLSWIPGFGNAVNAGVAATTTAAVGKNLINICESFQKEALRIENADKFEKIIKKLGESVDISKL